MSELEFRDVFFRDDKLLLIDGIPVKKSKGRKYHIKNGVGVYILKRGNDYFVINERGYVFEQKYKCIESFYHGKANGETYRITICEEKTKNSLEREM